MKHKRSKILINPRFQLRFAFFVTSWVLGLSLVFPMILNEAFSLITDQAIQDPQGLDVAHLIAVREKLFQYLYFIEAIFALVIFLLSIFLSHRVAGPLYKLNLFLQNAAKTGTLQGGLKFRSGDHFTELADSYNAMVAAVQPNAGPRRSTQP
ncbi:MAG: hypothetical protein RJB38_1629 [Pseudomonadota bacterium]